MLTGTEGDATPFTDVTVANVSSTLHKIGFQKHGNEVMYSGHTGRMLNTKVCVCVCVCRCMYRVATVAVLVRLSNKYSSTRPLGLFPTLVPRCVYTITITCIRHRRLEYMATTLYPAQPSQV